VVSNFNLNSPSLAGVELVLDGVSLGSAWPVVNNEIPFYFGFGSVNHGFGLLTDLESVFDQLKYTKINITLPITVTYNKYHQIYGLIRRIQVLYPRTLCPHYPHCHPDN